MIKNVLRFFLDTYVEVKFHALSIYEVFRAIRARQTTLWSLARCWYKKTVFFILNAVSGPYGLPGLWIFCIERINIPPLISLAVPPSVLSAAFIIDHQLSF